MPEFFISFLTEPGDLVLDPFGGSNVTGAAAEALGRQWISCELDAEYVKASKFRFDQRPVVSTERIGVRVPRSGPARELQQRDSHSKQAWLF